MRCLTVAHTQRWHAYQGTAGTGNVYQGRFTSFLVQFDEQDLRVHRFVVQDAPSGQTSPRARRNWVSYGVRTRAGDRLPGREPAR